MKAQIIPFPKARIVRYFPDQPKLREVVKILSKEVFPLKKGESSATV